MAYPNQYLGSTIPYIQRIVRVFVTAQMFKLGSQKFKTRNTKPTIPVSKCNFMGLVKDVPEVKPVLVTVTVNDMVLVTVVLVVQSHIT